MPVKVIGMIGVTPPAGDATVHVIDGGVSPEYLVEFSRAHEAAGFDLVLVGYTSTSADGWAVATHAAAHTDRLGYLVAHRPGFVSPTLAARKAATFDQLSEGRLALHIIAGASDHDQRRDGDHRQGRPLRPRRRVPRGHAGGVDRRPRRSTTTATTTGCPTCART